jgi:ribonuclease P protein component
MLPAKNRLPRENFRVRGYRVVATPHFSLKTKDNLLSVNRIGVVIGTSVDKRATRRNFWERQVKAQFLRMPGMSTKPAEPATGAGAAGKDFIVTIFPKVKNLTKRQFNKELEKILK